MAKVFEAQVMVQEREKGLIKRARQLNNEALKERISLQEAKLAETDCNVSTTTTTTSSSSGGGGGGGSSSNSNGGSGDGGSRGLVFRRLNWRRWIAM